MSNREIKRGLALGSGGIKGMAHIGALEVFYEEGIIFDVVAGTSVGSLVGALYARGYAPKEIIDLKDELFAFCKADFVATPFGGLVKAMRKIFGGATFDDLKKPFAAVATDADTGEEVVISEGDLATAVAASCAVPPVFRHVARDGRNLVDGAFVNYVPSDAAKKLGAEKVVAINLGKGNDYNGKIKSALDRTYPRNGVIYCNRSKRYYDCSDVFIEPELTGAKAMGLKGLGKIYEAGYVAAAEKITEIKKILKIL